MKNARMRKVNYGSLKSERARALVENLEKRSVRKNPLISKILVATGTTLALIILGAMLTKIKNHSSAEIQKETPVKIESNKQNKTKKRIQELQNVIRIRAQLKDRLRSMSEPESEHLNEETEALTERLGLLQNHLEELDWDIKRAKYEGNSAQLEDMRVLRGKIEATIQRTEEELREAQIAWLVKSPQYAVDLHGVDYQVKPEGGF